MIATDEAALRCDLMETYRILDYRALPARQAALFAYGLGPGSRIAKKLLGVPADLNTLLLAMIGDAVRTLVWQNTEDGHKGRNRPRSIVEQLLGKQTQARGFNSPEDFKAWRESMIGGD
ncbi:MAG: hypothetical protein IKF98_01615 [Clostridia bacterium]|nr:hypothetical protein [Clostridia bacterium]